jgi:RNA polymerase-binding transcription factor DksA
MGGFAGPRPAAASKGLDRPGIKPWQNMTEVPVTARTEASHGDACAPASHLSTHRLARLRSRLLVGLDEEALRFGRLRATFAALTADSATTTDRDRAVAALRMFGARALIEEIEDAIVRMGSGSYGTCQSCHRPISVKRLEVLPLARFCTFCPAAVAPSADGPAGLRRRQECGEDVVAGFPARAIGAASPPDRHLQTGEDTWQPNR